MTYPEIVAAARKAAEITKEPIVVFQDPNGKYGWLLHSDFIKLIQDVPAIRMLLIMPNGAIVQ